MNPTIRKNANSTSIVKGIAGHVVISDSKSRIPRYSVSFSNKKHGTGQGEPGTEAKA